MVSCSSTTAPDSMRLNDLSSAGPRRDVVSARLDVRPAPPCAQRELDHSRLCQDAALRKLRKRRAHTGAGWNLDASLCQRRTWLHELMLQPPIRGEQRCEGHQPHHRQDSQCLTHRPDSPTSARSALAADGLMAPVSSWRASIMPTGTTPRRELVRKTSSDASRSCNPSTHSSERMPTRCASRLHHTPHDSGDAAPVHAWG